MANKPSEKGTTGIKGTTTSNYYNPRSTYGVNPSNQSSASLARKAVMASADQTKKLNSWTPSTNDTGSVGGSTATTASSSYDRGSALRSQWDSYWNDLQNYFKALYDKELATNRNEFDSARNQANVKKARNERALRAMLGPDSGRGVSLLAGNNNTWANTIGALRNNLASANSTSLANYNYNLANGRREYVNKLMDIAQLEL